MLILMLIRVHDMFKRFIVWLLKPRWIKDDEGGFGLRLCRVGINLVYYKDGFPVVNNCSYEFVGDREFGVSILSIAEHERRSELVAALSIYHPSNNEL